MIVEPWIQAMKMTEHVHDISGSPDGNLGLLASIFRDLQSCPYGLFFLNDKRESLQVGVMNRGIEQTQTHGHNSINSGSSKDEVLLVLRGNIEITIGTIENPQIKTTVVKPFGAVYLREGVHAIKFLEPETLVFEVKRGPYQSNDKFILKEPLNG
jgi:hypothetical protein